MNRLVLFLAAASLSFAQSTPTPDDQARFLAGLPPREGSPLFELAQRAEFARHAKGLDLAWEDIERRQLGAIRGWMQQTLPQLVVDTAPLLYVFSGPDFLHANTFYPNASTYVLCGIEPVGEPPDVTKLEGDSLDHSLRNLRNSLEAIMSFSFFITAEMKNDFSANATKLSGTIPVIYTFLARSGCHIDHVEIIGLDKEGREGSLEGSKHPGVKIGFTGKAGQKQTMYYFSTNLASYMIKMDPGFVHFCEALAAPNGFTKSASYLMHLQEFDAVRDLLLAKCSTILQDDTGVRWKDFPRDVWTPKAYGWYPGPIALFKEKHQSDLAAVYKAGNVPPIPFGIGYNWRPKMSTLIFAQARREIRKAIPVLE